MVEFFVLSMCLYELECNMNTKAYLAYRQDVRQGIKIAGKKAEKEAGKEVAILAAVSYTSLYRQKIRAKLPYNLVLEWNFKDRQEKRVDVSWRYDF